MPGPADFLLPLAALGVGAYAVKRIVTTPSYAQLMPVVPGLPSPNQIIQIGGALGLTPDAPAPISASSIQGSGGQFSPTAPASSSTFLQWVSDMFAPAGMKTSETGRNYITQQEGVRNTTYQDVAGYWTVGIGHKIVPGDGINPGPGVTLSSQQIADLFNRDVATAENVVKSAVQVPLTQGQFDALVDFVFNLGAGNFLNSTLLRKLNARDYAGASAEFGNWVYAGNQINMTLLARRKGEENMFNA